MMPLRKLVPYGGAVGFLLIYNSLEALHKDFPDVAESMTLTFKTRPFRPDTSQPGPTWKLAANLAASISAPTDTQRPPDSMNDSNFPGGPSGA